MKLGTVTTRIWVSGLFLVLLLLTSIVESSDQKEIKSQKTTFEKEAGTGTNTIIQNGKAADAGVKKDNDILTGLLGMPVYRPPLRGAPGGRVGGGTRGADGDELPSLCVLVPDHAGLTVQEQSPLYWFVSELTPHPIEFTLIEYKAIDPLVETRIVSPTKPGVQCIYLSDYGIRLQQGVIYQWFVALVLDPESRSKDLISGGTIICVEFPEALREKLSFEPKEKRPHIYAQAGLWYDALSEISAQIEKAPNNRDLREQRASLLKQVELPEIAQYEVKQSLSYEQ